MTSCSLMTLLGTRTKAAEEVNTLDLNTINFATIAAGILLLVGGLVCIVNPDTLTFQQYLDDVWPLIGGVAVGRGIASAKRNS